MSKKHKKRNWATIIVFSVMILLMVLWTILPFFS